MITIVIPMAGKGSRFQEAGYDLPKPLIDVAGKAMIDRVLDSLHTDRPHEFVFICLQEHLDLGLQEHLEGKGKIVPINEVTEGAACTVLLAGRLIEHQRPLVIANCDQYISRPFDDFLDKAEHYDGLLMTFNSTNPHHSYVKKAGDLVSEVAEKVVISDRACAGIYYYEKGIHFTEAANWMIRKNIRTNGEFYITPTYNELIEEGMRISDFEVDVKDKHMLGTPYELDIFLDKVTAGEVVL